MSFDLRPHTLVSCGIVVALCSTPAAAGRAPDPSAAGAFDVTVGAGALMRPTYLGSDRYQVSPLPLVAVNWNDTVSLGPEGLSVYWHDGPLKLGAGLTFDGGRDEKDHNGLSFRSGDGRLKGMGKIDASIGYQMFASYRLWKFDLDASVTKYEGDQNKGVVARVGAGLPLHLTSRLVITPQAGGIWANDRYMRTYFGVSPLQAQRSGYSSFEAGSGFLGAVIGLKAHYALASHWYVMSAVSTTILTGDAKASPLTYSNTATTAVTAIGYRF